MSEHEPATAIWGGALDAKALETMTSGPAERTLGGHASGAIAELHPHLKRITIYRQMTEDMPDDDTPEKEWGRMLEPNLLRWAELKMLGDVGPISLLTKGARVRSRTLDFQHAHPDALFEGNSTHVRGLVSAKQVGGYRARFWGKSETDRVPDYCNIQEQKYMGVMGEHCSYVVASIGGRPPELWVVPFNQESWDAICQLDYSFMKRHVTPRVPPDPDGSEAYKRYISDTFKNRRPELLAVATADEMFAVVASYKETRLVRERAEKAEALARQRLEISIGEYDGLKLTDTDEQLTYRKNAKPSKTGKEVRVLRVPASFTTKEEE